MQEQADKTQTVETGANPARNCCLGEPRCKDDHVCDYYTRRVVPPIHLGGIYEPSPAPTAPPTQLPPSPAEESDHELERQHGRQRVCGQNAQSWAQNFKADCVEIPSRTCINSEVEIARKQVETKKSKPVYVLEQFGGISLGYGVQPVIPPNYADLRDRRRFPDYPIELHMKKVCKQNELDAMPTRMWDDSSLLGNKTIIPKFSPAPSSASFPRRESCQQFIKRGSGLGPAGDASRKRLGRMPISSDDMIRNYVKRFNLQRLIEHFLSLACLVAPDNPFKFISEVAGRMMMARDNEEEFKKLDRIFHVEHVSALFRLFDKEQNGFISHLQYKTAMETLGLLVYNSNPEGFEIDKVTEPVFVSEA